MYAAVVQLWNQKQVEISNTDNGLVLTRSEQPRDQNTGEEVGPPYLREKKTREGTGQGEEKRQHAMEQQYVT